MMTDATPIELRLAAIITLLSSSALRGPTANKTDALREHLEAAVALSETLNPHLQDSLKQVLLTRHDNA